MAIHVPTYMEPFNGTEEEWRLYFGVQAAAIEYVQAYGDTIGIFALFSPKKRRVLKAARIKYHKKVNDYTIRYKELPDEPHKKK